MMCLVKSGSGKSGVAYNVNLEEPEGDFVLINNNGVALPTSPQPPLRLQKAPLRDLSPSDVVKKIQQAEARRASEMNKKRGIARAHNKKVDTALKEVQLQHANKYWQLDTKLRAAHRRREELVAHIRSKAQEHSARVGAVNKANETKVKSLDAAINNCLDRATENRKIMLEQIRGRIAVQNAKKEQARIAAVVNDSRATKDIFWSLDRKLQEADRRRKNTLAEIREKARSPSEKVAMIREVQAKEAEVTAERLAEKLDGASARCEEVVNTVKTKAKIRIQKVEEVTQEQARRKSKTENDSSLKLMRAEENRAKLLAQIRRCQRDRANKGERVRQTKRAILAEQ